MGAERTGAEEAVTSLVSVARVVVEADGAELAPEAAATLSGLRVQHRLSLPSQCELTFSSIRGALDFASDLQPGASLRVSVTGQDASLFDGQVTAIEYVYGADNEQTLRVRGYDLLHQLRKRQTVRAHVQVSVTDLAREMLSEIGVGVVASASPPSWPHLIQHRQSDFDFLSSLAERCGLYMTMREGELHLITLEGTGDSVSLRLGENLIEARVEVNGDQAADEVSTTGWDVAKVERHSGSAGSAQSGRDVLQEVSPDSVGASAKRELVDEAAPSDDHAEALAQAEIDLRTAREVTFYGVAEGDASLMPGMPVDVTGLADEINGTYVLTSVTHTLDARSGFVSELGTAPPSPAPRPHASVATLGVVTRVDDPDDKGRVRVSLPTFGDVETDWLGVLCPAAGPGKGLVALPDVDDKVLVLSLDGDPGRGFVIGGLYGTTELPDTGVEGGAIKRYTFVTPGGQMVRLDDDKNLLRLETSTGNFVELAPGLLRLHATTNLTIEAPGRNLILRGAAIDFETG